MINKKNILLTEASANWTAKQWIDYLSQKGIMTQEEFDAYNKEIIDNIFTD